MKVKRTGKQNSTPTYPLFESLEVHHLLWIAMSVTMYLSRIVRSLCVLLLSYLILTTLRRRHSDSMGRLNRLRGIKGQVTYKQWSWSPSPIYLLQRSLCLPVSPLPDLVRSLPVITFSEISPIINCQLCRNTKARDTEEGFPIGTEQNAKR